MDNYWTSKLVSRRSALRSAAVASAGAVALSLAGCGGSDKASSSAAKAGTEKLDWTKGIPGGLLNLQNPQYPESLDLVTRSGGQARFGGLSQSGLLSFAAGRAGVDPASLEVEPDAALALPEQPNEATFVFKIRPGIKFHNGRTMTSEDVKYSLDRFTRESVYKAAYDWIDSVQATDAQTVTIKARSPNADALYTFAIYQSPFILAKEHEEGPDAGTKLVGTGPYVYVSREAPVSVTFRKNPDYFLKPLPYFDQVVFYPVQDAARRVADFISRQVQFSYWYIPEERDQIKTARPDAQMHSTPASGFAIYPRVDQEPYKDKRVRQALSRSVNRDKINQAIESGEGQAESGLAWSGSTYWGARNPKELKSAANWVYDPAAAKQLLSAAGYTKPIETPLSFTSNPGWQAGRDTLTLAMADWKQNGIADLKATPVVADVHTNSHLRGQFEGSTSFFVSMQILFGTRIKQLYWSPATGWEPGPNAGRMNDTRLNALIDKNLAQFNIEDRRATVHEIDELMGDEQYRPSFVTRLTAWFTDPSLKNASVGNWASQGTADYLKYWWYG